MPRYYREKIWTKEERRKAGLKLAALHEKEEEKRKKEYTKKFGSLDGYEKAKFEAKKAEIINYRRKATNNRKDV